MHFLICTPAELDVYLAMVPTQGSSHRGWAHIDMALVPMPRGQSLEPSRRLPREDGAHPTSK